MKLYDWLEEQPFTLSMSSGFFSFFAHTGMLAALVDHGLKPGKLTGSSAGALVGGCYASGCSIDELKAQLFALQRDDFWDPGFGLGLLKGDLFRAQIRNICKVSNVEECPIPFRASAFNLGLWDTEVIDQGCLTQAIAASCAFPFLFQPVPLNGARYLDGGIKDRPGLQGTQPGERIFYHHIGSRSPWRRRNSPALQIPQAENMQAITISDLPRVGPNKLQNGVAAYEYAYAQTGELLQQTITAA
ncbi:patatin [Gammaproteobacteria bacterium 42_54_T18]|nr:patatin [Gammaproteobacteria bacterium 42_54_T18]